MVTQQVAVGVEIDGEIVLAGVLLVDRAVSSSLDRSIGRFRYAPSYLRNPAAVALDPVSMPLVASEFRFARFGGLPGALRDSAPDNWGRALIERVYRAAEHEGPIAEVDYLLSSPRDRTGNLHFSSQIPPVWGDREIKARAVPALGELQRHVDAVLRNPAKAHERKVPPEVEALLTGAGGARPKVNIKTIQGTWIVKLAKPDSDKGSMARMEAGSLELARLCGIESAEFRVRRDSENDMVLVRRFDCDESGRRRQMVSAMTVLGASDQPFDRTNWSYPMFARELDRWSADPAADKLQLFRCMVLRAMVSDADDHPRNYALIRTGTRPGSTLRQWRLSPMYDCVVGSGKGIREDELAMTVGQQGYTINKENILSDCDAFGLGREVASAEVDRIEQVVLKRWNDVMRGMGLSDEELAMVGKAIAPLDERLRPNAVEQLMARLGTKPESHWDASAQPAAKTTDSVRDDDDDLVDIDAETPPRPRGG